MLGDASLVSIEPNRMDDGRSVMTATKLAPNGNLPLKVGGSLPNPQVA